MESELMGFKRSVVFFVLVCLSFELKAQEKGFLQDIYHYIENPTIFKQGQEEPRAYYIPQDNLLLDGSWKFFYGNTPEDIPVDFYKGEYKADDWDTIPVPSNWEMVGFGDPFFRNVGSGYPISRMSKSWKQHTNRIPLKPTPIPQTPVEYNPTGAYLTTFIVPENWNKNEVFLRFDKIGGASFVWVNGKQVGFNEGSHEPSEYNISAYFKKGENKLAVLVTKFSDGYYLEGVDAWRLAGIMDNVHVFATPKVRLFDWQVLTNLDSTYANATVQLDVDVKNYETIGQKVHVMASLIKNGRNVTKLASMEYKVGEDERKSLTMEAFVAKPELWTAETPSLYELNIQLLDENNTLIDQVRTKIGFKETKIVGNTFYLNGKPIKINGINSHMQHPEKGRVMTEEVIRKDMEILKQFNINAVRASHYPPSHLYLDLANEYGIYIIDEVNDESHQSQYLSNMDEYKEMYKDRARKAVARDRNYPCVLFWSAGNESGDGNNINEVIQLGKQLDPSRYWMYGGNKDPYEGEDIVGPRYPLPVELEMKIGLDSVDKRPSFMDEYLSLAGNAGGGLDEYWRTIYSHSKLMGGAIWDFISPGITEPIRKLVDESGENTQVHIMGRAKLVDGPTGKAIDLNGHDQWIEVYNSPNMDVSGEQLSIVMDIFPRKLSSMGGYYITKGDNEFGIVQAGTKSLDFYLYSGEKKLISAPLPENWEYNWHHIIATYNGKSMKLFIDGKELASEENSGVIVNFPWPVNIGRNMEIHGDKTDEYICDALIDNVGIFKKAIVPGEEIREENAVLWLGFDKELLEGNFYSYGIGARTYGAVWPDRKPQPEMWQIKKVGQPLSFKLLNCENGTMEVWNRSCFVNASHWKNSWTLTEDDKVLQSGDLEIDVKPMERKNVKIPYRVPKIIPGKEYRINISSTLRENELWAPAGFEISWDQFELQDWYLKPVQVASKAKAKLSIQNGIFEVSGQRFKYQFNQQSGELFSMCLDSKELLKKPLSLNIWRAPIATELDSWSAVGFQSSSWKKEFGWTISTEYYSAGLDKLKRIPMEVRATEANGVVHVYVRDVVLFNNGAADFAQLDKYISGQKYDGLESNYDYSIDGDGAITLEHEIIPQGTMPHFFPRIGLSTILDNQYLNVKWYGRGPQENYPDRKTGYPIGIYKSTIDQMYEPYLKPQDFGLRTDNRWIQMTDGSGDGIEVSMDCFFNFNAYHFTTENLTNANYTYQLQKADGVTLNLDYSTTGVGETARGILSAYRVYPQNYKRIITIKAVFNNGKSLDRKN